MFNTTAGWRWRHRFTTDAGVGWAGALDTLDRTGLREDVVE
jgi:hypothetical protein